jgi:hypothetical protein
VIAWIVIGTFCIDSERRCAVTVISSSPEDGVISSAAQAVPAEPLRIAVIAHISF